MDWAEKIADKIVSVGWTSPELASDIAAALRKAKAEGYTMGFNETAALILAGIVKAQNEGVVPDKDELALKVATRICEIENPTP